MVCAGVAAQPPGKFIPQSPLDESERAAEKARIQKFGVTSDDLANRMLDDVDSYHVFRDADIFAAFPQLRGHERLWSCQNRIMGGAAEIAFLVERGKNEATLAKLSCTRAEGGITCGEPDRGRYFFNERRDQYFTLDGLTFATAKSLLAIYRAKGVTGLPDFLKPRGLKLNSIKALSGDRYKIAFGDGLCSGCFSTFNLRRVSKGDDLELVYDGEPNAGCF
jgi:hypothetical protein